MIFKLYYAPGACSLAVHAALELAGVAFEPVLVKLHQGEHKAPEYLALNPRGQVPLLVDGDDAIGQIVAMVLHVDAAMPQAQLLPASGLARTRVLETLGWLNSTVHPAFTRVFRPGNFAATPQGQADVKTHGVTRFRELLQELEAHVARCPSAWLNGEQPGILDTYALTLLRWGALIGIDPASLPATWALVQRLAALPAVARVLEREQLVLNPYQPAA